MLQIRTCRVTLTSKQSHHVHPFDFPQYIFPTWQHSISRKQEGVAYRRRWTHGRRNQHWQHVPKAPWNWKHYVSLALSHRPGPAGCSVAEVIGPRVQFMRRQPEEVHLRLAISQYWSARVLLFHAARDGPDGWCCTDGPSLGP